MKFYLFIFLGGALALASALATGCATTKIASEPAPKQLQRDNFESARALEALERWSEAAEVYRSIAATLKEQPGQLQALALYRLSFCRENLGDDQATLAALRDVESRRELLPPEIAEAEFPARMAGAYARIGNLETATVYYNLAERGLRRIRARLRQGTGPSAIPSWLPPTLYQMGRASLRPGDWANFVASLRPLEQGQTYLLQTADTGVAPWAQRAADDLTGAYGQLLAIIAAPPVTASSAEDRLLERRRTQEQIWDMAEQVLRATDALRARRLPPNAHRESRESAAIFSYLDGADKNLRACLAERPAGEGPTVESAERTKRRTTPRFLPPKTVRTSAPPTAPEFD